MLGGSESVRPGLSPSGFEDGGGGGGGGGGLGRRLSRSVGIRLMSSGSSGGMGCWVGKEMVGGGERVADG